MVADYGEFDHVIVGGGTAGCVLANRLSAEAGNRVLLLEAGGRDWNPMFHVPAATGKLLRTGLHGWQYRTDAEPRLGGRRIAWPRGKTLGGSSSINGMVYIRGNPRDYDRWAELGNAGWSYAEVLEDFKRSERQLDPGRDDRFHGRAGEMRVAPGSLPNPLYDAFLAAGAGAGFRLSDDFNGADQEGFARYDFNICGGRRQSAAVAFLGPARPRRNLAIATRAHAQRILVEEGRAAGVEFRRCGKVWRARARRGVVLSAGTIGTPHLMMLSGLGPAAHLRGHGIAVVRDLPGVGGNLQDHPVIRLVYGCRQPITLHQAIRFDRAAWNFLRALVLRSGPFAQFPMQCGAFTRSDPALDRPDVQWHFGALTGLSRLRLPFVRGGPLDRDGYAFSACVLRPKSRGEIRLASSDPMAKPSLRANYLSAPEDLETLVRAFRQVRQVAAQPAFDPFRDGELLPGAEVEDDDAVRAWIRSGMESIHHQAGTCRMGRDGLAVVDERLAVHGVGGLRIADASVMPEVVSGNTQAAVLMIAERASRFLLDEGR